ncbi:MAG: glutaredoxin [Clostridia bacterium]|nr:glutaredoxin [Clostridia bacterium]
MTKHISIRNTLSARICLLLIAVFLLAPLGAYSESPREVLYFYINYCESCTPEEDFREYFRSLTGSSLSDFSYRSYNTAKSEGKKAYEEAIETYNIENPSLPLVIVDQKAYAGASSMETELAQYALTWHETTDSTVIYLYVPACESCKRVKDVLASLPERVQVKRGNTEFTSNVVIMEYDISRDPSIADTLFQSYSVPDEKRITPSVFINGRYLSGADDIEKNLPSMISLGWAAGGVSLPEISEETEHAALSVIETIGAGLAAGVNTCALSMIIMFVTVIMELKKNAGLVAFTFLFSKFICYLLIGFAFLSLLQSFNPTWLKPLAKIMLTAIGAVLIFMNLLDAYHARKENYGQIHNQLPSFLRKRLHGAIRSLSDKKFLIPAVIVLGFIVALGEFLCAGQLYLIKLLKEVEAGEGGSAVTLIVYCLAFIAPSGALCVLAVRGSSSMRMSQFLAAHIDKAKLITSAVMLIMILSAWLM